jgi:hypothetical protein
VNSAKVADRSRPRAPGGTGNAGALGSMPLGLGGADGAPPRQLLSVASLFSLEKMCTQAGLDARAVAEARAGAVGADARAIGGALLPLYAHLAPDRELFLKLDRDPHPSSPRPRADALITNPPETP